MWISCERKWFSNEFRVLKSVAHLFVFFFSVQTRTTRWFIFAVFLLKTFNYHFTSHLIILYRIMCSLVTIFVFLIHRPETRRHTFAFWLHPLKCQTRWFPQAKRYANKKSTHILIGFFIWFFMQFASNLFLVFIFRIKFIWTVFGSWWQYHFVFCIYVWFSVSCIVSIRRKLMELKIKKKKKTKYHDSDGLYAHAS